MEISKNHFNPAYHADLYEHYSRLIEEAPTREIKAYLLQQQEHHATRYTQLMECQDLANEFSMPVEDLIKLSDLVKRRMDTGQDITLDHDDHRIIVKDAATQCVVAWFRTKTLSNHPINR